MDSTDTTREPISFCGAMMDQITQNHIVLDNWLSPGLLRAVAETWPHANSTHWHAYRDKNSVKLASRSWEGIPRAASLALDRMAEIDVESLLGLSDAFPDLDGLNGAGLHQMSDGGFLGLHLDAESHPLRPWIRAASGVLYLDDCDGGELELCDDAGNAHESITPKRNRLALFTCPGQWHRVKECRSMRRSLCLFWWTSGTCSGATSATFTTLR